MFKHHLFLLSLLMPFLVFAAIKNNVQTFDLNHDGIKDRFEYFEADKVVRIEEDLNGDKKIDNKIFFDRNGYFEVIEQDSDFDGKIDRKKSFSYYEKGKIKVFTEVGAQSYTEIIETNQPKNLYECYNSFTLKTLNQFALETLTITSQLKSGFLQTNFGYRIDDECLQKWGKNFLPTVEKMAKEGIQCLKDLHTKTGETRKITGALKNAYELSSLLQKNSVTLVCSETENYDWVKTVAHASTNHQDTIIKPNTAHPFISINPKLPESKRKGDYEELLATLFHEQLHNLGMQHFEGIEYFYSCEDCCFNNDLKSEVKARSCKICSGNYKNEVDEQYVEDFIQYAKEINRNRFGTGAAVKFLKENLKSVTGLSMLAYTYSDPYNPIGPELAKIIEERHLKLNDKQNKFIAVALKHNKSKRITGSSDVAKIIAEALYELYYNKNGEAALKILEKNRDSIRQELEKISLNSSEKFPAESISEATKTIIYEMWLNKYPTDATYESAYLLHEAIFAKKKS
ncbi:MAG: hypothetical protein U0T83_06890 [Bacteriovoracaceae bacterium]